MSHVGHPFKEGRIDGLNITISRTDSFTFMIGRFQQNQTKVMASGKNCSRSPNHLDFVESFYDVASCSGDDHAGCRLPGFNSTLGKLPGNKFPRLHHPDNPAPVA